LKTFALSDFITAQSAQEIFEVVEILTKDLDLYFKQKAEKSNKRKPVALSESGKIGYFSTS
jgi:hypothetical protein